MLKRHEKTDGRRKATRWLAPLAALALLGCPNEDLAPLAPCTVSGVSNEVPVTNVDKVDLLFVIDNSNSMLQEQAKLARQLPNLVQILTEGVRKDGTTFTPVRDLHLGVVTSDMGSNGLAVAALGKGCTGYGDDGILTKKALGTAPNCAGITAGSGYLGYIPGSTGSNLDQTIATFSCLADVGINGCGFEQQLEAMYKAVAPPSVAFAGNRPGNANGPNAGFLRPEAVLAIIHVSDEEDCSVSSTGGNLFQQYPTDPAILGPDGKALDYNLRCAYGNPMDRETQVEKAEYIWPVTRYQKDFRDKVKPLNPDRIIFAAIVGIPDGTEGLTADEILAHPRMGFNVDPIASYPTPKDVCRRCVKLTTEECERLDSFEDTKGEIETGAKPAVRFVKIAKDFGDNGLIRSICAKEYDSAVDTIIEKISQQLKGACLPRELNRNSAGIVECDVVEVLQSGTAADCQASRGRKYLRTDDGKIVCSINQVPVMNEGLVPNPMPLEGVNPRVGWYYDTFSEKVMTECPASEKRRISFSSAEAEPVNAIVKFECFQPVVSSDEQAIGKAAVGVSCEAAGLSCENRNDPTDNFKLVCEQGTQTCQIGCEQDSQCPVGWGCEAQNLKVCINPTCVPPEFGL